MRLFVCLFLPLFLCASEQLYTTEGLFLRLLLPAVSARIVGFSFFPGFGTEDGVQRIITPGPCSIIIQCMVRCCINLFLFSFSPLNLCSQNYWPLKSA
jgi:hypothetical protein